MHSAFRTALSSAARCRQNLVCTFGQYRSFTGSPMCLMAGAAPPKKPAAASTPAAAGAAKGDKKGARAVQPQVKAVQISPDVPPLPVRMTDEKRAQLWQNYHISLEKNRHIVSKYRKPPSERKPGPPGPRPKNTPETTALLRTIYAAAKSKEPQKAIDAYHRLLIKPDIKIYTALITSMIKDGLLAEAVEIWHDIRRKRVTPNLAAFVALMSVCETAGHLERAMYFLKEMQNTKGRFKVPQKNQHHVDLLNKVYNIVLRISFARQSPSRAASVYRMMFQLNMKHTRRTKPNEVVPWEFMLRFVDTSNPDAEIRARQFHFELERELKPHPRPNPYLEHAVSGIPLSRSHELFAPVEPVKWGDL